jgi:hypothetical protein
MGVKAGSSKGKVKIYNERDMVKVIKVGRLRGLGHLVRMQEQNPRRGRSRGRQTCYHVA